MANIPLRAHERAGHHGAMLQTQAPTAAPLPAGEEGLVARDLIERLRGEIKFQKTQIEALNFEIARLKRWRFGSSSESLASGQAGGAVRAHPGRHRSRGSGRRRPDQAAARDPAHQASGGASGAARESAAHRSPPRHRANPLRLRPGLQAHRPRSQRAARLACRRSSSCCATFGANTPARTARASRPRRCPRRSST